MAETIKVLVSEEEVEKRIRDLGEKISKDYEGKQVHLICVLKGGVFFMCELAKRITVPVSMDFMSVSSYGDGTTSSGVVKIAKDLDESLEGKDVLVVEDIIDSGRTLSYLLEILKKRNPNSMKLCTLLDKPERRVMDVNVDYVGFNIPDEFVVGYGLDYAQKYRGASGASLLMLVIVLFAVFWFSDRMQSTEQRYTEAMFQEDLKEDNVDSVVINPNKETPTGTLKIYLKDEDYSKSMNVLNTEKVQEILEENRVAYKIADMPKPSVFTTVVLPLVLTVGVVLLLFVLMNRQAGGGANARAGRD